MAEKKKGFDLAEKLKEVSTLNTGADGWEQIQYIHAEHILPDERNFYELSGIDELAASIELVGLQQPLRVRPGEVEGSYVIVSGHRRHAALKQLIGESQELYDRFHDVPCIVERQSGATDEVEGWLQELRLIYGNSDTRKLTSADISKQAERVEMLLYRLKEAGVEFPGKMRDHVAEACKVSGPKLARLKVIRENLIPDYKAEWEANALSESAAYVLARFPADFQARLYRVLACWPGHSGNADKMEEVLKKQAEGWDWNPCLTCPDGKACKRGDTFLRRDCGRVAYQGLCGGKTCCLDCELAKRDWSPCEQMCSKAKAERKEKKDAKEEQEAQARDRELKKNQKITQRNAQRLLKAIEAAGLADDRKIPWMYGRSFSVKEVREWAKGDFSSHSIRYGSELDPKSCRNPVKVANLLGVSTDWVLGVTEELMPASTAAIPDSAPVQEAIPEPAAPEDPPATPAGPTVEEKRPGQWVLLKWISPARKPDDGQLVAVKFDWPNGEKIMVSTWFDGAWRFKNGVKMEIKPVGWFPLPGDEKGVISHD